MRDWNAGVVVKNYSGATMTFPAESLRPLSTSSLRVEFTFHDSASSPQRVWLGFQGGWFSQDNKVGGSVRTTRWWFSQDNKGGWFSQDNKVGGSVRTTKVGGSVRTTRWVVQSGQQGGWFSQDNKVGGSVRTRLVVQNKVVDSVRTTG